MIRSRQLCLAVLAVIATLSAAAAPTHSHRQPELRDKLAGGGLGPEMMIVPAGEFVMGSARGEAKEQPAHAVTFARPFAIARTEVTQAQWRRVMGRPPPEKQDRACPTCPVDSLNWYDAQRFVERLSRRTGHRYRLPSEAEWEYACLAGHSAHRYCGGNNAHLLGWSAMNGPGENHRSARKRANAWGLYDMSGNLWEWVQDCPHNYLDAPSDGTAWEKDDCPRRVLRGGSWGDFDDAMRARHRYDYADFYRSNLFGLRPVRELP